MWSDASMEPVAASRARSRETAAGWRLLRMPAAAGGYSALLRFDLVFFLEKRIDLVADWDWYWD